MACQEFESWIQKAADEISHFRASRTRTSVMGFDIAPVDFKMVYVSHWKEPKNLQRFMAPC